MWPFSPTPRSGWAGCRPVQAVALGGSRAQGTARPDSEWDLAVYYRGLSGQFRIEPLLFHLVGIPTYLLVAELADNQVLLGSLPRPSPFWRPCSRRAPSASTLCPPCAGSAEAWVEP